MLRGERRSWQLGSNERTFKFGVRIIKFVDKLPRTLSATELGKQLLRSGTSIAANREEANGAESRNDFIHKVSFPGGNRA